MGCCLVGSNLPEGHHMSSGLSIHCARDIYCYPFSASLGQCLVRVGDSGSKGRFLAAAERGRKQTALLV